MSDELGGSPPGVDSPEQLRAKLQGLERMRVAGLVREQQYEEKRARLEEQLDALRPAASAPSAASVPPVAPPQARYSPPASSASATPSYSAASVPPDAPPQAAYSPPAPVAQPVPGWQPRQNAAEVPPAPPQPAAYAPPPPSAYPPPPTGFVPPPPPPAWQAPQARSSGGLRTSLIATGVGAALILAAVAGVAVVSRSDKPLSPTSATTVAATPSASPTPSPTPDAAATLATLRNAQPVAGQPLVTPAVATQLVSAFWSVREQGLSRHNPDTIHAIEDGAAGEYDAIGCTYGCPPPSPRPLKKQEVMVPQQTSYPAAFMAQVLTTQYHTSNPMVEIMVFTRQSAALPWFISFDTYYSGVGVLQEFHAGPGDFDLPAPHNPAANEATLASQLAAYWQYWKTNGVAPPATHFAPGAFTSEQGLDTYHAWADERAVGVADHTVYTADSAQDGAWSFAVNVEDGNGQVQEGDVLTCATVRYRAVDTPIAPAKTVVQDTSYEPFGDLLRSGEYSSVTVTGLHESCMLTQPGFPRIVVEGIAGEQTRVVGVPFSGSGVSA